MDKLTDLKFIRYHTGYNNYIFTGQIDNQPAVLFFKPFIKQPTDLLTGLEESEPFFTNDRFTKMLTSGTIQFESCLIHPALPEDIQKYCSFKKVKKLETYEQYKKDVYPIIKNADCQWLYNIIHGKDEQDKILYQDDDFILMPDYKWNMEDPGKLYCLAIVKDKQLKSIRELTGNHVGMLESIYYYSLKTINDKFGYKATELRAYFHYHPSFWHLHIHFNLIQNSDLATIDRSHSLRSVIENLKVMSNYYQTVPLEICRKKSS